MSSLRHVHLMRPAMPPSRRWQQAYDLLARGRRARPLTRPTCPSRRRGLRRGPSRRDHRGLGAGSRRACAAGDRLAAAGAAVRVAMHLLFDTALMAPVAAGLGARRAAPGGPGRDAGSRVAGRGSQLRAAAVGRLRERAAVGAPGDRRRHEARARRRRHRSRRRGPQPHPRRRRRSRASALLDEAGVAAVSGELDPLSHRDRLLRGRVRACRRSRSTTSPRSGRKPWSAGGRGSPWGASTDAAASTAPRSSGCGGPAAKRRRKRSLACEELRPYLRREFGWPLTELGRIRLRRGDIPGAEAAFLAAHEAGWDPQPGLALVQLAQGDVALRGRSIRDALEHSGERALQGAAAEHRAAPGAPPRGAGRDRDRGRRRASRRIRGRRARRASPTRSRARR